MPKTSSGAGRKPTTIRQFFERFPDDSACLDHLMRVRFGERVCCPGCRREGRFHRVSGRRAYECAWCGHQVYPCVGTPFEGSRTGLQLWFYAMFLFCASRNGVSAKELQRQLGVTYKAAWRMGHEIRRYMGEADAVGRLGGKRIVEVDEAFIGGKDKRGEDDKTVVLGMVERGGSVVTEVIPDRREFTMVPRITAAVLPGSRIATDEARSFRGLADEGFRHGTVNHSRGEWVRGEVHTNTIDGFWAWVKRMIGGTHVWVSPKHLPRYLEEMEYRFNLRREPALMFDVLLLAFGPSPLRVGPSGPEYPAAADAPAAQ